MSNKNVFDFFIKTIFYKMKKKMGSIDFGGKSGQEVLNFIAYNWNLIMATCVVVLLISWAVIDMYDGHAPFHDVLPYETCKNWWSNRNLSVHRSSQSTNSIDVNKPLKNINDGVNLTNFNLQHNDKKCQKNHQEIVNYYHQG